ncbi:MAG TPA: helix-turn-helix domain-containing protein [Solirubrobacteraceae bacterium]|nr:helix-turn-helix domain-containing protein [Solirubrobacteraceae bacterium]
MPTDAELTFADHAGRFYARRYGFPPMVGRLLGYLTVCEHSNPTIAELAEALLASRSAIAGAVKNLETMRLVVRTRAAGERMDRVHININSPNATGLDPEEYVEVGELAREGLEMLAGAPAARRAVLSEMAAFSDFLVEQIPLLGQKWNERRAELVAAGELLPRPSTGGRR